MAPVGKGYCLLGELYREQGEHEKAMKAFKSGEQALLSVRNKWKLAAIYAGIAAVDQRMGRKEHANKYLNMVDLHRKRLGAQMRNAGSFSKRKLSMMNLCRSGVFLPM